MTEPPKIEDFPHQDYDKLRYGDLDTLGHVNNVVFATLFSTGRTGLFGLPDIDAWNRADVTFVIARLELDYHAELRWPGTVESGTGIKSIGKSSIALFQALYQAQNCVATAHTVMVQVSAKTHRPVPISDTMRALLAPYMFRS